MDPRDEIDAKLQALWQQIETLADQRPIRLDSMPRYSALREQYFSLIRHRLRMQQQPVVTPIPNWPYKWHAGHIDVRLVSRQTESWLACGCVATDSINRAVLLHLPSILASRLTAIDYDNLEQHPLYHSGLEGLGAYTVENSAWVAGLGGPPPRPGRTHYLFCFNSCLVECVARAVEAVCEADSVAGVWQRVPHD